MPKLSRVEPDCGPKTRCTLHTKCLMAVIAHCPEDEALLFLARSGFCGQMGKGRDDVGRNLLHVASSLGKRQLVDWLIRFKEAPINGKDGESGYTALHRSLLFGQIHVAELLIELGANMSLVDYEGFTPADIVVHARPRAWDFSPKNPCDVFLWGSNSNFNLGIGHQQHRVLPEILDSFRRQRIFIRELTLQKFHTAFLASDGRVYMCGHGRGGRLGLESEEAQLNPRLVKALSQVEVIQVALGTDHSVFLNAKGAVYTCGTNEYHQLGHGTSSLDSNTPQLVSANTKMAKGSKYPPAVGVAAARFHSVFWTPSSLFTWGLNAGQLGHLKGDKTIPYPKLVTSLNQKDLKISTVVCTDGATVILTESGELIALHEYQTRRITVRQFNVSKIAVVGGHLDFKLSSELVNDQTSKLVERGGEDLKVFLLYKTGKLAVWDESRGSQMFQCVFNVNIQLNISDIAVSRNSLVFLTKEGLAYEGQHVPKKDKSPLSKEERAQLTPLGQMRDKTLVYLVKVKRISGLHRCAAIFCDPKGKNFAVLQALPNEMFTEFPDIEASTMRSNMETFLEETSDMDPLHDMTFNVKGVKFAAHKFILASVSDHLARQMSQSEELTLEALEPYHFEQILKYAYTRSCDYLVPGSLKIQTESPPDVSQDVKVAGNGYIPKNPEQESAFSVHTKNKRDKKSPPKDNGHTQQIISNPLQIFRDICKNLCIHGLTKALDNMKFVQGEIHFKDPSKTRRSWPLPVFSRKSFPEFHDVCIKTDDGNELSAHRCILSARSDYFRGMFSYNWVEAKEGQILTLPVSSKVLPIILEFLYRDEAAPISASEDPELVCNTLVVADQLLLGRLVNLCESHLCTLLSLRNVAEIFQFALDYNAVNLERGAMQFICQNLLSVLESRTLTGMVSIEGLEKLSSYYVKDYLGISGRKLAFESIGPTPSEVNKFASSCSMTIEDLFEEERALKSGKISEKRPRRHSSGDKKPLGRNRTVSNTSFGSNNSLSAPEQDSKDHPDDFSDLSLDDLELQERLDINSNINDTTELTSPHTGSDSTPQTSLSTYFIEPKDSKDKVFNKKFVKKSQKERKKELESATKTPPAPVNVSNKSPWGGWAPVDEQVPEVSVLSLILRQSPKVTTPKEVKTTPKERRTRKQSWKQLSLTDEPSVVVSPPPQNPWKTLPQSPPTSIEVPSCSDVADQGFKEILNFEVKQNESLFRAKSKPLSVTQKEEKAIEELRAFYGADQVFDERISVVRVDQGPLATPIWKRK